LENSIAAAHLSEKQEEQEENEENEEEEQEGPEPEWVQLGDDFGFEIGYLTSAESLVAVTARDDLENEVPWHSVVTFENLDEAWQTIYSAGGKPVVIERRLGAGSLVLFTDSYLLSNEAMRDQRCPKLLSWAVGGHSRVLFEETHLGLSSRANIMTLMHKYRVTPVLGVLLLIGILFVWRNATPLLPAPQADARSEAAFTLGRDVERGRVNLLRRTVPVREILSTCATQWMKTFAHRAEDAAPLASIEAELAAEEARPARERNPVETYRRIAGILNPKKKA
jgi:hypothetical protein